MTTSTILIYTGILFIIIAVILFICDIVRGDLGIKTIVALFFLVFSFCSFGMAYNTKIVQTRNDSNVEWYLDGQLVNKDTVDPSLYSCIFSEDRTKVFMTHKQYR